MVQLVVKTQGTSALHYLDVSDVSIKGNYSAKEIQDLKSQKSDFTQAFTLPFTKTNNDFFSHFYNVVSVDGTFDSSIKCEADIYVDSNIVFSGYLQLLNVNNTTQFYEALVFGVISNIATSLDEKKLNELDLSEFSHVLTKDNVKDSWSGNTTYTTSASQTGAEILYPIVDYGYGFTNDSINSPSTDSAILPARLKPTINVKVLFEKVLASIGYTINSTFFATNFFAKQYMTIANEFQTVASTFQDSFRVGLASNQVQTSTEILDLDDDTSTNPTGDLFDLGGNWDTANATPHYNVPLTGFYSFKITMGYAFTTTTTTVAKIFIKKLNDASYSVEFTNVWNGTDNNFFNIATGDQSTEVVSPLIPLSGNDEVYFEIFLSSASQSLTIYKDQTNVELFQAPVSAEGSTIDLSANNNVMPTEKQVDFISAICSRYNLIIELDKSTPNQLNIEPAQDYFDTGTSKDWSDKIDMNKDRVLKPTNEFRKAKINMSDLEDMDRSNEYWTSQYRNIYNSFEADLQGDFGVGDLQINTIFSSWVSTRVQSHDMLIGNLYKWNNGNPTYTTLKSKLFFYSGLKTCQPYRLWSQATGSYTTETTYPYCNHYSMSGSMVESTDEDIRFKSRWALNAQYYVESQTTTDTYSKCWRKYLNNIYSEDSRILIANFYLTPEDIAQFKYNDKIFVENSYYRINKISSYALGKNASTKVELIKIIESNLNDNTTSVLGCDLTWVSSNINGTTVWQNSAGATVNPTQTCCEANNLTFDNNLCYWNIPSTPDEPSNPPISWDATANINTTGGKVVVGETASDVTVNDSTNIYLEGTIRRLGKDASNGEILAWNSATNQTNWIANTGGGGTPSSPNTSVQYNDNGTFKGEADFVYDEGNNRLTVPAVNAPILQSISGGTTLHQIYTVSQNMAIATNTGVDVYLNLGNASAGSKAFSIRDYSGNIVFGVTDTGVIKAIGNKIQDSAGSNILDASVSGNTKLQSVNDLELNIASAGASSRSLKFINNTTEVGSIDSTGNLQIDGTLNANNITITGTQGTDGQVLTSTGSGVAWEDATGGTNTNIGNTDLTLNGDRILNLDGNTLQIKEGSSVYLEFNDTGLNTLIASDNLDIGNFDFRAKSFTSDVATGTAPLVVSSTTQVANLQSSTTASIGNLTGEVTSTNRATVIADNVVDEANLKVSNAPVNGYVLTAQSGNTGGLTWAEQSSGGSSSSIITQIFTIAYHSVSTSGFYITMSGATLNENTVLTTSSFHLILPCPFDGTIKKITSHHQNLIYNGTSKFELYIDGDDDDLVGDQRGSDLTVTNGVNVSGSAGRVFTADCPSDWTFSKNETLAIKRTDSSGRGGTTVSFVIEFDTST